MTIELKNDKIKATFSTLGAEMTSVIAFGKERSWQNDNGSWAGHAPVLFPYAGLYEVFVNGVSYARPRHGFARKSEFEIAEKTDDKAVFRLNYNADTLKDYPFKFRLYVVYTLIDTTIAVEYKVENADDKDVYFACGGHDSFNTFASLDGYRLEFEKDESFDNILLNGEGKVKDGKINIGYGKTLNMPVELLENSNTVVFGNVNSRKVTLINADDRKCVEVGFEDYSNLLLWHPEGSEMICIEPWSNLPDKENGASVEMSKKDGTFKVPVGATKSVKRYVRYFEV